MSVSLSSYFVVFCLPQLKINQPYLNVTICCYYSVYVYNTKGLRWVDPTIILLWSFWKQFSGLEI